MIRIYGIDIGTLLFFVFSLLVGIVLVVQAVFFSKKETQTYRLIQGGIGVFYTALTVASFMQLELQA